MPDPLSSRHDPHPQVRRSGPGGAFLLFTTRQHQLHTVSLASLVDGSAAGLLTGGAAAGQPAAQQQQPAAAQGFRAAMKAAMRPTGAAAAAAAAGGVNVRSVEQNALLVAVPPGEHMGQLTCTPALLPMSTALQHRIPRRKRACTVLSRVQM